MSSDAYASVGRVVIALVILAVALLYAIALGRWIYDLSGDLPLSALPAMMGFGAMVRGSFLLAFGAVEP